MANAWYDADPSWIQGPDCSPEYPCIDCQDKQEIIQYLREDKEIAAKKLSTVIKQLYSDTTFDKIELNSAIEGLCQLLDVEIPYEILNVTRKSEPNYEHEYFHYGLDQARKHAIRLTK